MRNSILLLTIAALTLSACGNSPDKAKLEEYISTEYLDNPTTIEYEVEEWDFGTIHEGEVAQTEITFTNTGDYPLVIGMAAGTCGCTVPEYPEAPVMPGESGVLSISFNSKGKEGVQDKKVSVIANTKPNKTEIKVTGEVIPAGEDDQQTIDDEMDTHTTDSTETH